MYQLPCQHPTEPYGTMCSPSGFQALENCEDKEDSIQISVGFTSYSQEPEGHSDRDFNDSSRMGAQKGETEKIHFDRDFNLEFKLS